MAVCAAATIVVASRISRPYHPENSEPIAEQIVQHQYVDSATETRAPWLHVTVEEALKSPQFLLDRELFTVDLVRTGKVDVERARALADIAVREAYMRRIPPALVLGVMLTENDALKSSARSRIGAIGLMQVYPKPWRTALAHKFGTNIHADSTNLKYGIFILGWVVERAASLVDDRDAVWRRALLGYNGCVHGRNTHDCHSYPDVVRRQVVQSAKSSCRGADFDRCVVNPMWLARRDADHDDTSATQER